jgi:hypothetical protein
MHANDLLSRLVLVLYSIDQITRPVVLATLFFVELPAALPPRVRRRVPRYPIGPGGGAEHAKRSGGLMVRVRYAPDSHARPSAGKSLHRN